MARNIRLLSKKRGDRHTGSPILGGVGEALFFGILFLLGFGSLTYLLASLVVAVPPTPYRPGFGFWLMVLATGSLALLGGGGVIYTVFKLETSAERRAAMVNRAATLDLISDALGPEREFPGIPKDTNITNSPGIRLAYRLPVAQGTVWVLLIASISFLVASGVTILLATLAAKSHFAGRPDWPATLLVIPFLAASTWSAYYFIKQLALQTGIGPTTVEISDHPLLPGRTYQIYICQPGRLRVNRFVVSLVCQEETTYQQGTDIQADHCRVFHHDILVRSEFPIVPGRPFEHYGTLTVPATAMHSFQAAHNAIRWMLLVRCEAEKRPLLERRFPVIVYPRPNAQEQA